jgi:hypothetical protein
MRSLPAQALRVNPTRQREPLLPVSVPTHSVGGASRADLRDNAAVLSVTDRMTGDEAASWREAVYDGDRLTCFRPGKFAGQAESDCLAFRAAAIVRTGLAAACRRPGDAIGRL